MKTNVKYRKHSNWYSSPQVFTVAGYVYLAVAAGLLIWAYIARANSQPLLSPLATGPVPVYAKEPEVVISCEDPRGYLECQAYQKVITWDQYRIMEAIAEAESHFNENALGNNGDTVDRGIFQINNKWHKKLSNQDAFNFKKNIDYAIKVMKESGYTQWSAYKNGSYKQYLNK